jgi:predicted glutamine amidotransferase
MCRLIAAIGVESTIPLQRVLETARVLARGGSLSHERPEMSHTAGWGYILRRAGSAALEIHRSGSSIENDVAVEALGSVEADLLLIHLRNASGNNLCGLQYAHPQSFAPSSVEWHIMHNGSIPGLAARMGAAAAHFDTASYIRYAVPAEGDRLDREALLQKLDALPDYTASNAFLLNRHVLYVVNHFPPGSPFPRFYTMHRAHHGGVLYIASEALESLAPAGAWAALQNRSAVEINLSRPHGHMEAA